MRDENVLKLNDVKTSPEISIQFNWQRETWLNASTEMDRIGNNKNFLQFYAPEAEQKKKRQTGHPPPHLSILEIVCTTIDHIVLIEQFETNECEIGKRPLADNHCFESATIELKKKNEIKCVPKVNGRALFTLIQQRQEW